MILRARRLLLGPGRLLRGGALRIEQGCIREVLSPGEAEKAVAGTGRGSLVELEDGLLAPGFVDAHAHLELSMMEGRLPASGFVPWIKALLAARMECAEADFEHAVQQGAQALLSSGTTTVGDVDSTGASAARLADTGLRAFVYREVLDAGDPRRTPTALRAVQRALPRRKRLTEGLSPHAPYTASDELLAGCLRLVERRSLGVMIHWAEAEEEAAWLLRGEGPLAALLEGPAPGRSGLERIDEAGLLGPHTILVHGNHAAPGELRRIAAAGASLVHCPGTHRHFAREPLSLASLQQSGVGLALGSDSLASNTTLDMRHELRLAAETLRGARPRELFELATVGGARSLGREGELGRLEPGYQADLVWHAQEADDAETAVEALAASSDPVRRVWVAGRAVWP